MNVLYVQEFQDSLSYKAQICRLIKRSLWYRAAILHFVHCRQSCSTLPRSLRRFPFAYRRRRSLWPPNSPDTSAGNLLWRSCCCSKLKPQRVHSLISERKGFLFAACYYSGICMKMLFYAVPTRQHGITSQNTASIHWRISSNMTDSGRLQNTKNN